MGSSAYQDRDPMAKAVEEQFKDRDRWAQADAGRMGGSSSTSPLPTYDHLTDRELIERYLKEREDAKTWANDTR